MAEESGDSKKGQTIINGLNHESFVKNFFPKPVNDATDAFETLHGLEETETDNLEFIRSLGVEEEDIKVVMAHTQATGEERDALVPSWKAALRKSEIAIAKAYGVQTEQLVASMKARNDAFYSPEMMEVVKALAKK